MAHRIPALLALVALLAPVACVTSLMDPTGSKRALRKSQLGYTQLVRWGELEKAADFVDPALRQDYLKLVPAFKDIRISEYEIGKLVYGDDGDIATISVRYRGYSQSTLTEKTIREVQEWRREGVATWRVRPQLEGIIDTFQVGAQ